jgi:hypothetical protein
MELYGALPQAALVDLKNRQPLLSWRVALLPYLEQDELYRQFKLNEPWDSEHNKKLIAKMPRIYAIPGIKTKSPGLTHYRVFVGPGTAFEPRPNMEHGHHIKGFIDGTSTTFLTVEASEPTIWTKPDDLAYDPKSPPPKLGVHKSGAQVLMGDGSVWTLSPETTEQEMRTAIVRNDGEHLPEQRLVNIPWRGPPLYLELQRRK